ncbi:LacI family DNA-binding transcriptional regulator [Bacillus sp. EB01]|uniref:LacI family DNA-binding transcriptional regulator n=1 Tax=Bacillus sp. EB01 TaxID=1347086 RepID=UPI0006940C44|nr:LacI family DNA-binding transcriptional regulator [Bacillus sp. EB01]
MTTIKDVSRLSGISIGTVSRYLNGYKIKKDNEEKIKQAIKELDYKVNQMARGLKTNKTYTVGVLIPSITDIFINQVIEGMEEILDNENYSLIVCNSRQSLKTEKEKIDFLKDKRVDGIIMMPVSNKSEHVEEIIQSDIPIVLIDRLIPGIVADAVICDNVNGSYRAVEEAIRLGHRRIGMIAGPTDIFTAQERLNGYIRALNDYMIPIDESLILHGEYKKGGGLDAYQKFTQMEEPPSVIFATNYETTMTGIKYFMEKGIKIGEDISLFGYDDSDVFQMLTPKISTVRQPMNEIGETAALLLLKRIDQDYSLFPTVSRLKTKLLEGNSVKKLS